MEGHIADDIFREVQNASSSGRRVPGSGIARDSKPAVPFAKANLTMPPSLTKSLPKLSLENISPSSLSSLPKVSIPDAPLMPAFPKQWRHVAIFALAVATALLGVEKQNAVSAVASDGSSTYQATTVSLPKIEAVTLPPVPIKKAGVKSPYIGASHYALIDDASKTVLYGKAEDEQIAIASTTKVITALVALDNYEMDDIITISAEARNQIGSSVMFKPGETITVNDAIHGLLMVSGNDSAYALAEHMAQPGDATSTERFVAKMNTFAKRLGLENTHFYDPAGLNDAGHSTAKEMSLIISHTLDNNVFKNIVSLANYQYTSPEGYAHDLKNSNRLVTDEMYYSGIIGGKTGFTPKTAEGGAGHCLIVAAERDGHRLIAAVYNTDSSQPQASAQVARALLEYGFNSFEWQELVD